MTLVPVRGVRDGEPVAPAAVPLPPDDDGLFAARNVSPLMRFDSSALARSTTPWLVMVVGRSIARRYTAQEWMARRRRASDAPSTLNKYDAAGNFRVSLARPPPPRSSALLLSARRRVLGIAPTTHHPAVQRPITDYCVPPLPPPTAGTDQ